MQIKNYRVMLYIDDEYYGDLTSIEQGHDEQEFEGWIGAPIVHKIWKSNSTWEFKLPGMELAVRKFLHVTPDTEKNVFKVLVDSGDIYVVMLYPYENKPLYIKAYEMVINAQVPHTVYNEDTVMIGGDNGESITLLASTTEAEADEQERLLELLPGLKDKVECPVCKGAERHAPLWLWDTIQHVNDEHEWTREQIADWLETLDSDITFPIGEDANGN